MLRRLTLACLILAAGCASTPPADRERPVRPLWSLTPDPASTSWREIERGDVILTYAAAPAEPVRTTAPAQAADAGVVLPAGAELFAVQVGGVMWNDAPFVPGGRKMWCAPSADDAQRWCLQDDDGDGAFERIWRAELRLSGTDAADIGRVRDPLALVPPVGYVKQDAAAPLASFALVFDGPRAGQLDDAFKLTTGMMSVSLGFRQSVHVDPLSTFSLPYRAEPLTVIDARDELGFTLEVEDVFVDGAARARIRELGSEPVLYPTMSHVSIEELAAMLADAQNRRRAAEAASGDETATDKAGDAVKPGS